VILSPKGDVSVTAEVAILNKTAVALAADSAVTISAGASQHKIFDSADKLFELTQADPIAVMINNDMSFMEAPLPVLIKEYRNTAPRFARVADAGDAFLSYLNDFAAASPNRIKLQSLEDAIRPAIQHLSDTARESFLDEIIDSETGELRQEYSEKPEELRLLSRRMIDVELDKIEAAVNALDIANFVGEGPVSSTEAELELIARLVEEILISASDEQKTRAQNLMQAAILRKGVSRSSTGIVFAGFGHDELFPTLVCYELEGVVGNRLKYSRLYQVDIDREGTRARVLPFAQREMVERFLYGLDMPLRKQVSDFCSRTVSQISEELLQSLDLDEAGLAALRERARLAEQAFCDGLSIDGFEAIQQTSEAEIEEMVEFMPKAEMARMAEALVNLTSIKRRVSRGFETVGGPIDVAIISKAEGFVWVSRKHYFPRELNDRYFNRIGSADMSGRDDDA
jgi:hypothetical protein